MFGTVAGLLGLDGERVGRIYLYLTMRGLVSSAVRLGMAGPLEAQSIQHALAPVAERAVLRALAVVPDDAAQMAPLLDLIQGMHDRLYSRLFQS